MDTSDRMLPLVPTLSRTEHVFPTLTPEQVSRIAPHGRRRPIRRGEVLLQVGDKTIPMFVVISGEIEAVRPSDNGETIIVRLQPGQFSGEGTALSGRSAITQLRVSEPGEAIELTRDQLFTLIQTDTELSEIMLRAFILRRK